MNGRWRVRRQLFPHAGPVGTPAYRWCVQNPRGEHLASSQYWHVAVRAADQMARASWFGVTR